MAIEVTITCKDCGTKQFFIGEDFTLFLEAIERAGWYHLLEVEPHSGMVMCPECHRKREQGPK